MVVCFTCDFFVGQFGPVPACSSQSPRFLGHETDQLNKHGHYLVTLLSLRMYKIFACDIAGPVLYCHVLYSQFLSVVRFASGRLSRRILLTTTGSNSLHSEVLRCVVDMLVRKRCHEVVTVIVIRLHSQLDAVSVASLLCCFNKILWQKLALLVKIVASTLYRSVYHQHS